MGSLSLTHSQHPLLFVASSFALGIAIGRRCARCQLLRSKEKNGNNMLEAFRTYAKSLEEFEEPKSSAQSFKLPNNTLRAGIVGEALDPADINKTLKRGIQDLGVTGKIAAPGCAVGLAGWQKGLHDFDIGGVD